MRSQPLFGLLFLTIASCSMEPLLHYEPSRPTIRISPTWEVLGPFQIGTREASWGADPLENQGGFRCLVYDSQAKYRSSLANGGFTKWSLHGALDLVETPNSFETTLRIGFSDVDWAFLQLVYGWAALQYQAWARGYITVGANEPQIITLSTENILEFWVDENLYFGGDLYAYGRAPLVLQLQPGDHRLDVRLIRDLRAMGGMGEPLIEVKLKAVLSIGDLAIVEEKLIAPDVINGKLAGRLASVPVRNEYHGWINIVGIETLDDAFSISKVHEGPLRLAPGQSRPLLFHISMRTSERTRFSFKILFSREKSSRVLGSPVISHVLSLKTIVDPHKMTFLHPSGILSYAILRAPVLKMSREYDIHHSIPVFLNLHGAGLEADSDEVRHSLDPILGLRAWVLFPTGVTPWGDDWHSWSYADVDAAIASIREWIELMGWIGPAPCAQSLFVTGHSNGGQGTWFALTHQPDKVIAAAPVSGYASIQTYVPYQFWYEMDPRINMIIQTSLATYRHELLIENFAGIPVLHQHGDADDNVPVYHSRRLGQLTSEAGWPSGYEELADKGHWFEGVMTTQPLRDFYASILEGETKKPQLPRRFGIVVSNPADMGSRGGIFVDELATPDQTGRIDVNRNISNSEWTLITSNIFRLHFSANAPRIKLPEKICVDGSQFVLPENLEEGEEWSISQVQNGSWQMSQNSQPSLTRHKSQFGGLAAILRTPSRFVIYSPMAQTFSVASQLARNLFQYLAADSEICVSAEQLIGQVGNVFRLSLGTEFPSSLPHGFPIMFRTGGVSVRDSQGSRRLYRFQLGMGAIFLVPGPEEVLQIVIWGYDSAGLHRAARLVPMLTGVGQPDFVLVSPNCGWKGASGVLSMGFFDRSWNVSQASYLS